MEFKKKQQNQFSEVGIALLYNKETHSQVPLASLSYSVEIVDSLAFISLFQTYHNPSKFPIETEYFFSISPDACFYEFLLKVNDKTIKAMIKEKEEAKQEFEEILSKGRLGGYSEINPNLRDVMQLNIGNIPPNTQIEVKFSYLKQLEVYLNKFWRLNIPGVLTPRYRSEKLMQDADKFLINGADYVSPFAKYQWDIKISIKSSSEITFANSPTHNLDVSYDNLKMVCNLKFTNQEVPNKDFVLFYRNQLINQGFLALESLKNDEKYPFCAMISLVPDFNPEEPEQAYSKFVKNPKESSFDVSILQTKAEFIVLLDRSGSMAGGRIKMAIEALIFFLKSLPPDSLFNIYSFGDTYELLSSKSLESTEKNINWTINKIKGFDANFGGTIIYEPLKHCFANKPLEKYPRTVFLITDGGVSDTLNVISLISQHSNICRTYSLGIGNGCSAQLIVESAIAGKGKYEYIGNLDEMNEKVIYLLQDAISPYISGCEIDYDKNMVELVTPLPKVLRKNEAFKLFLFMNKKFQDEKSTSFKLSYYHSITGKKETKSFEIKPDDSIINNDFLHKIGISQTIQQMSRNFNYKLNVDSDLYIAEKADLKTFALKLSLKYQILSELTAFICVLEEALDQNNKDNNQAPKKILIPNHESVDYDNYKYPGFSGGGGKILLACNATTKSASCCGGGGGSYSTYSSSERIDQDPFDLDGRSKNVTKDLLLKALQKQKTEGFWDFDRDLLRLMSVNNNVLTELENRMKGKEKVLMTILVLLFLEKKQGKWKGTWILIFNKAKEWLKQNEGIIFPEIEDIIPTKLAEKLWN